MTKQSGIDIVDGRQGKVLLCYVIQKCRRQIVPQSTATEATPSCNNFKEVHPVICTSLADKHPTHWLYMYTSCTGGYIARN